jgi:hypothetical protein
MKAGQARMQMSIHANVVGLLAGFKGNVPASLAREATPESLTCRKREGTLTGRTDSGRRKQPVSRFVSKSGQLLTPRSCLPST